MDQIVHGDLLDILACRSVLVWAEQASWGTAMEVVYAHQLGTPVVAVVPDGRVSPWLRFHSDAIVGSLEEAVAWINSTCA